MPILNWIGKDKVVNHHLDVPYKVLEHQYGYDNGIEVPSPVERAEGEVGNKIIHGDNLEALKSLLPEYEGKIKCIYIDPPYNTGKEEWLYNDKVNSPQISRWINKVVGKEGEDLTRDDKWLCMMYPRLKLLHKLLAEDGIFFCSIDDYEQANLKLMLDEIFGKGNFINNIIWQRAYSPINTKKRFSPNHDFILCYAKRIDNIELSLERTEEADLRYSNPDNDPRGDWKSSDLSVGPAVAEKIYEIVTPTNRKILPPKGRCWVLTKERFEEFLRDNRIWFGESGNNVPSVKRFKNEVKEGITPMTVWTYKEVGHTQDAKKEIKEIFPESDLPFETPKSIKIMERIVQLGLNSNSIVLDAFAGSGTTAQAVLNLNKQDGGNRKFILIEMEEFAQTITAERVKRVINGYSDKEGTRGSFDYYELGPALFNEQNEINELVGVQKLREYIYYTETREALQNPSPQERGRAEVYLLNKHNDTAYYFFYEQDSPTTLNYEFLSTIKTKAEQYIIYADNCLLTKEFMTKHKIIFKKIPRDITKF
jgi:adenine-specific DNA-methyltransferase